MVNFFKTFKYLYQDQGTIGKCWQLFRRHFNQNGLESTIYLCKKFENLAYLQEWNSLDKKIITILTPQHTVFISELISNALKKTGIEFEVKIKEKNNIYNNNLYIVLCPQSFKKLPKNYIAFQLEQTVSDRWFGSSQIKKLKNALLVVDYSLKNIEYLSQYLPLSQLYYLPISPMILEKEININNNYKYDILFYGDTNNPRREKYLNELKKHFNIKIINNSFKNELWEEIQKSKIVINIHYYEEALLETTRLYECLSNNALVISEKSSDFNQHNDLADLVDFVDIGDIEQMVSRIHYYLNNNNEYNKIKSKISKYINKDQSNFDFYFYRVLLALGIIDFDFFYENTSQLWCTKSNFWSLGLPESIERQNEFVKELNKFPNIWNFPGLRHTIPWIGCGMSYKYMIRYAKDNGLERITICEDDVLFPNDFTKKFEDITYFLDRKNEKWDIFSGHITDLNELSEINVLGNSDYYTFLKLNKTTGMVFNIYNQSIFNYILNWNEKDYNLCNNAIDRYIEKHTNLNVITTSPYLAEHKDNIPTTLWNRNCSSFNYKKMSEKSEQKILKIIDQTSKSQ